MADGPAATAADAQAGLAERAESSVGDSWRRGWAAFNELLVHTLVILFVIGCIESIEAFIKYTRHGQEIEFFKGSPYFAFPAQWLFDAADIAMIAALLTRGVIATYRVYSGSHAAPHKGGAR